MIIVDRLTILVADDLTEIYLGKPGGCEISVYNVGNFPVRLVSEDDPGPAASVTDYAEYAQYEGFQGPVRNGESLVVYAPSGTVTLEVVITGARSR